MNTKASLLIVTVVAIAARTTLADTPLLVLESSNINVLMADRAQLGGSLQVYTVWGNRVVRDRCLTLSVQDRPNERANGVPERQSRAAGIPRDHG